MTSKLKCPVCPYCDKLLHCGGTQYINERIVAMWHCQNAECEETEDLIGTREMWEIVANKIQAKQDLEIARKALEDIKSDYELYSEQGCRMEPNETDMYNYARKALGQIEHKDK